MFISHFFQMHIPEFVMPPMPEVSNLKKKYKFRNFNTMYMEVPSEPKLKLAYPGGASG